jgi:probable F420-dependent oxidoreductase
LKAAVVASLGIGIGGPYAFLGELGRQIEARGFDSLWVSETGQDSIVQATVLAMATERIDIGTNITLAFPRSPTVTAQAAWDLNELSDDRFVVGLGSQVRRIVEERFSADFDHPAKRMGEYVQAMRAVWAMERGEMSPFRGDIYRVLRPGLQGLGHATERAVPRVHVAAVGPLMTKAAATHADGILGHPFTSDRYLADDVVPGVEAALDDAGRSRDEFTIATGVILCVSDDRDQAIREAKQQIAFYGTTPNYKGVFASYGDEHLTGELASVFTKTRQDIDAMVAAVPDEAVERYAVAGTPGEVRPQIEALASHVDHLILGGAWYQVSPQRMAENLWAIVETFGTDPTG